MFDFDGTAHRLRAVSVIAVLAMCLMLIAGPLSAAAPGAPGAPNDNLPPLIKHNPNNAPTGYTVTFRYRDPSATRVQIKGEWYFENPWELPALINTVPPYVVETPGLLPEQWKPGDVPIASPNSTAANWPVADLTKNGEGIWTYTTPLPSGVFTYGFFVDCASDTGAGCTEISDPSNPPWNQVNGVVDGSVEPTSQVNIPSDPAFGTVNYWWQLPADGPHGTLTHVTYDSPGHRNPVDQNYLAIYTPPNYDPNRAKPYPTFYLLHGGGGNEMDWSTQGNVANIMDNLIDDGEIQPMFVVMPTSTGYSSSSNGLAFRTDLTTNVFTYMETHYNVSTSAADRAFSGLSAGGVTTNQFMLYQPDAFGSYGMMSAGFPPVITSLSPEQAAALMGKSIFVGAGWQDPIFIAGFGNSHTGPQREVGILVAAGVPVTPDFINGGHEWYVWRILLKDFLTRVAFWPPVAR